MTMAAPQSPPTWLIVVAASAGGLEPLIKLVSDLPPTLPAAVVIVQHRPAEGRSMLGAILARRSRLPVVGAEEGQPVQPGTVYVARPDAHLTVTSRGEFSYQDGTRIRFVRSSANPLFESAAGVFEGRVIAIVLSGGGADATDGVQAVRSHGGWVIAQDPASAAHPPMPQAAIATGCVNYVVPAQALGEAVRSIICGELPEIAVSTS
jgi:two-component system chemotaxis response regulator CheB